MLSSIRNWSSIRGQKARHPLDDRSSGLVRLRPVGAADSLDEGLHVLPLPVEMRRRDRPAVSDVEGRVRRELVAVDARGGRAIPR